MTGKSAPQPVAENGTDHLIELDFTGREDNLERLKELAFTNVRKLKGQALYYVLRGIGEATLEKSEASEPSGDRADTDHLKLTGPVSDITRPTEEHLELMSKLLDLLPRPRFDHAMSVLFRATAQKCSSFKGAADYLGVTDQRIYYWFKQKFHIKPTGKE